MINNVAYFPLQCANNSRPVLAAVLDCLQARGIKTQENSMTADAAIIWSVLWAGKMRGNQAVYQHYTQQGRPVIVVEVGSLRRGHTWKLAVNNVTAQGYYGHLDNLDWDRPAKLNIELGTASATDPSIVIGLQHSKSLQVAGIENMSQWLLDTLSRIRNTTDRPIRVRPHPRDKIVLPELPPGTQVDVPRHIANTYDNFDMRYDCHAVVNYNSGLGIQAAIAGVRPVVDYTSLAYPVGMRFADIEQPYTQDRDLWLTQICHTEYTVQELRAGLWFERIQPALQ